MARLSATDVNKCFKSRVNVLVCAGGIDMTVEVGFRRGLVAPFPFST
jgi:hypothetical protein